MISGATSWGESIPGCGKSIFRLDFIVSLGLLCMTALFAERGVKIWYDLLAVPGTTVDGSRVLGI